jgi:hypothetical protein
MTEEQMGYLNYISKHIKAGKQEEAKELLEVEIPNQRYGQKRLDNV